jgi:hypothetical protein
LVEYGCGGDVEMDQRKSFPQRPIIFSIRVLIIILIGILFLISQKDPTLGVWVTGIMIGLGFLIFVAANIMGRRYKKLGTYEQTTLFGHPTEANNARKTLYDAGVGGCAMFFVGVIALILLSIILGK